MLRLFGKEFYFARHGQTANNAKGLVSGGMDVPLDSTGREQALNMAGRITNLPVKTCIVSPLDRAVETATLLLSDRRDLTPVAVAGLEERGWGKLEGTSKYELDNYVFAEMGVERWDDFVKRTIDVLLQLDFAQPVFIVAHSGTFRAICEYLNVHYEIKPVKNACPYHFYEENGAWKVREIE